MNATSIIRNFNEYRNSYNAACRYIIDIAKLSIVKLPAEPAKNDESDAAKLARSERKRIAKQNELITSCQEVKQTLGLTDGKDKTLSALRPAIVAAIPYIDSEGNAVKFVKMLPAVAELANVKDVQRVVAASWIETLCAAAENKSGKQMTLNVTTAPELDENAEIAKGMQGDVVDMNGNAVDAGTYSKVEAAWNRHAIATNKANNAVKSERDRVYHENVK